MKPEIEDFIRQGQAEGWGKRTVEQYRQRLEGMASFLRRKGRSRVAEVQANDLDDWMRSLAARGVKRLTRRGLASTARSFFRQLVERGKILSDPSRYITQPIDPEEELPPPPLSEQEVAALLDGLPKRNVIDLRNRAHIELLYGTAIRISESLSVNVADIDFSNRLVKVKGKGGKERMLPLGRGAMLALRDYLALRRSLLRGPDHGALFLGRYGTRLTPEAFRDWLRKLNRSRLNGKRLHPHLLRHSAAVHMLRAGADIRHVQEFLGHSNLDTTKIYLRMIPGRLKDDYVKSMPEIDIEG